MEGIGIRLKMRHKKANRIRRRVLIFVIIILGTVHLFSYVSKSSFYTKIDPVAKNSLDNSEYVAVDEDEGYIRFTSKIIKSELGIILFPGTQTEPRSNAYLAGRLATAGYNVYIKKPLKNLGTKVKDTLGEVIENNRQIKTWVVCAFADDLANAQVQLEVHPDQVSGLIMVGSYPDKRADYTELKIPTLCILASRDGLYPTEGIDAIKTRLPKKTDVKILYGGNHTQFYLWSGAELLSGDNYAVIDKYNQQDQMCEGILDFIAALLFG
jgi:hypothetical protein